MNTFFHDPPFRWIAGIVLAVSWMCMAEEAQRLPDRTEIWVPAERFSEVLTKHPNAVMLTGQEYEALIRDAGKVKPSKDPKVQVIEELVIESMRFTAAPSPADTTMRIQGEVTVKCLGDGWSSAVLQLPFQNLAGAAMDGTSTLKMPQQEKDPFTLLVKGRGEHNVKLEFREPIYRDEIEGQSWINLHTVAIPASLELTLQEGKVMGEGISAVVNGNVSTWSLHRGPLEPVYLRWSTGAGGNRVQLLAAEFVVEDDSVLMKQEAQIEAQTAVLVLDLRQPNTVVESLTGDKIKSWRQDGNKLEVTLNTGETASSVALSLRMSHSLASSAPGAVAEVSIPHLTGPLVATSRAQVWFSSTSQHLAVLEVRGADKVEGNVIAWKLSDAPPVVVLRRADPQVMVDVDALVKVARDDVQIVRTLMLQTDRPVNELTVTLPAGEEFVQTEGEWKRAGQNVKYTWQEGLHPGVKKTVRLESRKRLTKDQPLSVENIVVPDSQKLAGYVALDFDPMWRVAATETSGLEERDARQAPVKGRMAWFALRSYKLVLQAARRDPVYDAQVAAYALPRARTIEIEGQVALQVTDAPVREVMVKFSPADAKLVRWTSPLVGEQTLDEATGMWKLTLRRETLGRVVLRFRLSQPAAADAAQSSVATKLSATLPSISLPQARRFHGTWVVEANTDTELSLTAKAMQPLDVLKAPQVEGYALRHRAVSAYEFGLAESSLKVDAVRHPHSELASMLITGMKLRSVISQDGSVRHEARIGVKHSGEQFFNLTLPTDATLLSTIVDDQPIKPVRGPDGSVSIPLPPDSNKASSVPVRLVYDQKTGAWNSKGTQKLQPPSVAEEIAVMGTDWEVYAPAGYELGKIEGGLQVVEGDGALRLGSDGVVDFLPGGARQSADDAVAMVTSQIQAATEGKDDAVVWESQPGAVRVYDANGRFADGRELFRSAGEMIDLPNAPDAKNKDLALVAEREIARRKTVHTDASNDQPRSRMLNEVTKAWEADVPVAAADGDVSGALKTSQQMRSIIIPKLELKDASVEEALEVLRIQSRDHDPEPDPAKKGVSSILNYGDAPSTAKITLSLTNVPLDEALRYVAELAGMKIKVEPYGVLVVPTTENVTESFTRIYQVPSDFLASGGAAAPSAAPVDPFADANQPRDLNARRNAKQVLTDQGIQFPDGTSAVYVPTTGQLIVKNTAANLDLVEALVSSLKPSPTKAGLMSLDLDIPVSGQRIRLVGGQGAGELELKYVSWERLLVVACVWMALGAAVCWWIGRRRWVVMALLVAVLAFLGVGLVAPEWQRMANAFALGWLAALLGWLVVRVAGWWAKPAMSAQGVATVGMMMLLAVNATAAESKTPSTVADPAAHEVFVPFDGKSLNAKPKHYYLERGVFEKLWRQAKENRKPEPPQVDPNAPDSQIVSALHRVTLGDGDASLRIESRLQVVTAKKWVRLEIKGSTDRGALTPSSMTVDGEPSELMIEQPGVHQIEIVWEGAQDSKGRRIDLALPGAVAGLVQIVLSETDGWPDVDAALLPSLEGRTVTMQLPANGRLRLARTQRRQISNVLPPPVASVKSDLRVTSEATPTARWQATWKFPGAAWTELGVVVDPTWEIADVGQSLPILGAEWRTEGGKTALVFKLVREVNDEAKLDLYLAPRTAEALTRMPRLEPIAGRWDGVGEIVWSKDLTVETTGISDEMRLPVSTDDTVNALNWRTKAGSEVGLVIKAADPKAEARVDYLYQVSDQKLEMAAAMALNRVLGQWQQLRVTIPDGMDVQSVQGPALVAFFQQERDLYLHLQPNTGREARVVLHMARTVNAAVQRWDLQPVHIHGVTKSKGTVMVAAHAALEVKLENFSSSHEIHEVDPAGLTEVFSVVAPVEKKRAVEMELPDWKLGVTISPLPVRFSADGIMLVQATNGALALSQQVVVSVEQGALKKIVIRLPVSLPEANVTGELLREVQTKVNGNVREYECSFQSQGGLLGWTTLTFDTQLPLTDAEVVVPMVEIPGAERMRRYFVLDNSSSREQRILAGAGVEACAKEVLPYLPEVMNKPAFYQGRIGANASDGLKVTYSQLQATEGNAAVVTLADIKTLLRTDGERWDTVQFSVFNRSLQFLPVILDARAELIAVTVGGEPVRADEEKRGGKRVRLVPLIQTQPGQRSMEVRMVYRVRGKGKLASPVKLDDPEVAGISAERTVWSVSVPQGYELDRKFQDMFGNMEEVAEEGRALAETESWLSDFGRLNRMFSVMSKGDYKSREKLLEEGEKLSKELETKIGDLEQKVQAKSYRSYDVDSKPQQQQKIEEEVTKLKQELGRQKIVLTENRIPQPVFDTRKANVAAGNNWLSNGKIVGSDSLKENGRVDGNAFNDNIGVNGGFFKLSGVNTYTGGTVINGGTLGFNATAGIANSTSNARGNNVFSNSVASEPQVFGTGGTIMVNGGTLQVLPGKAPSAPAADPFAAPAPKVSLGSGALVPQNPTKKLVATSSASALSLPDGSADGSIAKPFPGIEQIKPSSSAGFGSVGATGGSRSGVGSSSSQPTPIVPAPPPPPAPKPAETVGGLAGMGDTIDGLVTQNVSQLRPTGRRSMMVEVPMSGQTFHFRKLKDHAVLELSLSQPLDQHKRGQLWQFFGGLALVGILWMVGRRK